MFPDLSHSLMTNVWIKKTGLQKFAIRAKFQNKRILSQKKTIQISHHTNASLENFEKTCKEEQCGIKSVYETLCKLCILKNKYVGWRKFNKHDITIC